MEDFEEGFKEGYIAGVIAYARWKDGEQSVGIFHEKLNNVIDKIKNGKDDYYKGQLENAEYLYRRKDENGKDSDPS